MIHGSLFQKVRGPEGKLGGLSGRVKGQGGVDQAVSVVVVEERGVCGPFFNEAWFLMF